MIVYRISKLRRARDLSGIGSSLVGGRWNIRGLRAIYTSLTPELALLEYTVHVQPLKIPKKIALITIAIDSRSMKSVSSEGLPDGWNSYPFCDWTIDYGSNWLREGRNLCLKISSAIMPLSKNIVINASHSLISQVRIKSISEFIYDPRLKS